ARESDCRASGYRSLRVSRRDPFLRRAGLGGGARDPPRRRLVRRRPGNRQRQSAGLAELGGASSRLRKLAARAPAERAPLLAVEQLFVPSYSPARMRRRPGARPVVRRSAAPRAAAAPTPRLLRATSRALAFEHLAVSILARRTMGRRRARRSPPLQRL